jgi:hypothetical protein
MDRYGISGLDLSPETSAQMYAIFNRCVSFLPERYPSTSFNICLKKMDGRPW